MAPTKHDANVDTIAHLETLPDPEKHYHSLEEEILGRDFTVAESELPKGYFTSANFLGSSGLTCYAHHTHADDGQCSLSAPVSDAA